MIRIVFWVSFFLVLYPYFGYPLYLWLRNKIKRKAVNKVADKEPPIVSIVMAVKNGEEVLVARLENFLAIDYPLDKLQIIAISDGSTDRTNEILYEFTRNYSKIIKSIVYTHSKGKPYALNKGVGIANGEILVFADSRQVFEPEVVRELVANFQDENIGCVSGELCFREDLASKIKVEMGAYWKFEKWLRKLESSTGSVVGATGAIYAIRKELYKPLPVQTLLDDVLTPMNIVLQGYRVVFDPDAIAYDTVSKDLSQEKKRKLRTLAGNWQLLNLAPTLFTPWSNPIWFRFISHKICRLIVPFLLPVVLFCARLDPSPFYQVFFWLQLAFYCMALLGCVSALRGVRVINFSYFFVTMNLIAAGGFFIWCTGKCRNAWKVA